jgi:hypothetical protein
MSRIKDKDGIEAIREAARDATDAEGTRSAADQAGDYVSTAADRLEEAEEAAKGRAEEPGQAAKDRFRGAGQAIRDAGR